jgi:hypothetical protein
MGLGGFALDANTPRGKLLATLAWLGTRAHRALGAETLAVLGVLGMRAHIAHIARQEFIGI